uniref:ATP-binding cassette domain-containing protein n=1 Tax=Fervidicoccus fontis TaxID=683846 RepID=A0A7J3ZJC7_9CREN
MKPTNGEAVLELEDLWIRYPGRREWTISSTSLKLRRGEFCLVLGETGSGKTTIARAVTGVAQAIYGCEVRGSVRVLGREVSEYDLDELRRVVQVVNQNPYAHFTDPILREDLLGYAEALYDPHRAQQVVEELSDAFGIRGVLARSIFELSGGQIRRAAIVKALVGDPEILVLDEPLMWLDNAGLSEVLEALARLKRAGKTVLVLEHKFFPLLGLASRVTLLSNGRVRPVNFSDCLERAREHEDSKLEASAIRFNGGLEATSTAATVRLENVWFKYDRKWVLEGASLTAKGNRTYIVYGENGSGKSTLLKLIAGYLKPSKGRIAVHGRPIYIPQLPYLFFTEETLRAEVEKLCRANRSEPECPTRSLSALERYGYGPEDVPFNLSWGQMLRLAVLASILVGGFNLLLLDEPFSGLTYSGRVELARLLNRVPATKVITASGTDLLGLFEGAIVVGLRSGRLTRLEHVPQSEDHIELAYRASKILYGEARC